MCQDKKLMYDFLQEYQDKSHVYVITGADLRKVGMAKDPELRLRSLQACSPVKLAIENIVPVVVATSHHAERTAHNYLGEFRRHNEWFSCDRASAEEALDAAENAHKEMYKKGMIDLQIKFNLQEILTDLDAEQVRRRIVFKRLHDQRYGNG